MIRATASVVSLTSEPKPVRGRALVPDTTVIATVELWVELRVSMLCAPGVALTGMVTTTL